MLQLENIAALRALNDLTATAVCTHGYADFGDGGHGRYRLDPTDTTSLDDGALCIVGADGGRRKLCTGDGSLNILQFGAKRDGLTDNSAAFAAAVAFLRSCAMKPQLHFPEGQYNYSVGANWGIPGATILADGAVHLRHTGTGNGLIFDAGKDPQSMIYDMTFGQPGAYFYADTNGQSTNGVYIRGVHHSLFAIRSNGARSTGAGLRVEFAVCSEFHYSCTPNGSMSGDFHVPLYGLSLSERNPGESTSYCLFPNAILEGCNVGIYADSALGNLFLGGTSEGNSSYGVQVSTRATSARFFGIGFEANNEDILDAGFASEFIACDTAKIAHLTANARFSSLVLGVHQNILIDSPAGRNLVAFAHFNKLGAGTFVDNGAFTRKQANFDVQNGVNLN